MFLAFLSRKNFVLCPLYTTDNKYKTVSTIELKCVTVIVPNFTPHHFAVLREDAILDKRNMVQLTNEHKVNPLERMANFEDECMLYASKIIN